MQEPSEERFIIAWLIAPVLSVSPWILFFFPFFILWQDMAKNFVAIVGTGAVLGVLISAILGHYKIQRRLVFIIIGTIVGHLCPLLVAGIEHQTGFYSQIGLSGKDPIALGVGFLFGGFHGALSAYFFYKIAYERWLSSY